MIKLLRAYRQIADRLLFFALSFCFWRYFISANKKTRLNEDITAPQIRLIGVEGEQLGIVSRQQALLAAEEADLDLVEIAPQAQPPVCRIMDYGKYLYKLKVSSKTKQKQIQLKEVKFRFGTEEGDIQIKVRKLISFLNHGDKVKITLRFRGREMAHKELGMQLIKRILSELEEYGAVDQPPKFEGRQIVMLLSSKKK